MPQITRYFIKTGLLFFILALLTGVVMEVDAISLPASVPLFWHMLMVGWITQIIFGVSIWMFPGRTRENGFEAYFWEWVTYLLINTGLAMRVVAEPWLNSGSNGFWETLILVSALTQFLAALTFTVAMWPRLMTKKERFRKRKQRGD